MTTHSRLLAGWPRHKATAAPTEHPAAISTMTFSIRSQSASNACIRRRPSSAFFPARRSGSSPADTGARSWYLQISLKARSPGTRGLNYNHTHRRRANGKFVGGIQRGPAALTASPASLEARCRLQFHEQLLPEVLGLRASSSRRHPRPTTPLARWQSRPPTIKRPSPFQELSDCVQPKRDLVLYETNIGDTARRQFEIFGYFVRNDYAAR